MAEKKDSVLLVEKLIDKMVQWTSNEGNINMRLANLLSVEFGDGPMTYEVIVDQQGEIVIIEVDPGTGEDNIRITLGYEEMTLKVFEDLLKAMMAVVFHWNYIKKGQVLNLLKNV